MAGTKIGFLILAIAALVLASVLTWNLVGKNEQPTIIYEQVPVHTITERRTIMTSPLPESPDTGESTSVINVVRGGGEK